MTAMINKLKNLTNIQQILSFAIVGVGATLTHASVFHLCYEEAKLNHFVANLIGFAVAFLVSYLGQFKWTFKQEAKQVSHQGKAFLRFFQTALIGLGLNLVWASLVLDWLQLHHYVYLAMLTFVTPVLIFLLNKFWVFKS